MANANLKTKLQHLELPYIKLYRKVTHNIVNSNLVGAAVDTIAERKGVRTDKLHEYRFFISFVVWRHQRTVWTSKTIAVFRIVLANV